MNPYESPEPVPDESLTRRKQRRLGGKPWWAFVLASAVGAFVVGPMFLPLTASFDDSGGTQMLVGAILVPLVYQMLF